MLYSRTEGLFFLAKLVALVQCSSWRDEKTFCGPSRADWCNCPRYSKAFFRHEARFVLRQCTLYVDIMFWD